MQKGFYFDQTRCTGCYTCTIACKDWHEVDLEDEPQDWIRVLPVEKGVFPDLTAAYLVRPCMHCAHPPCADACPVGAISKRGADGVVVVDRDACMGNEDCDAHCQEACPYGVPAFGPAKGAKMQKCDLCSGRASEGKSPVCVEACPMFALDVGPLAALQSKYGELGNAEGFIENPAASPSILFKPKKM